MPTMVSCTRREAEIFNMTNPRTCIVLGMHRSGTSTLARIAGYLGCFSGAPEDHLQPNQWNAAGYLEHKKLVQISGKLLHDQGCTWSDVLNFDPDITDAALVRNAQRKYQHLMLQLSEQSGSSWLCGKDPRLCLTLAIVDPNPGAVLFIYRHPLAVAKSLDARDGLGMGVSMALWEFYTLSACRIVQSLGDRALSVSYQQLSSNPKQSIAKIERFLRTRGAPGQSQADVEKAVAAVRPIDDSDATERYRHFMLPWHKALWKALDSGDIQHLPTLSEHSADVLRQHHKLVALRQQLLPTKAIAAESKRLEEVISAQIDGLRASIADIQR